MSKRTGVWLGLVGLLVIPLGCKPLPKADATGQPGVVAEETLPSTDVVPLSWGRLVSVTYVPEVDGSVLWFQDDAGNVRAVRFNHGTQRLWSQARLVRRQ